MNTFARYWIASTLLFLLSVTPFVLLLALLVAPLLDGLAPWWSISVVFLAYANTLGSEAVYRRVQQMYASIPAVDPNERVSWWQPRLSHTQQELMSIDLDTVRHASWSRFIFPTVLLVLAVVSEVLSQISLIVLIGGFLSFLLAWLFSSAMLMWPLHRHIYLERGASPRRLLIIKAAMWGTYGLVWVAMSGALLLFLVSSLSLAVAWSLGLGAGVALALWKKPLTTNSNDDSRLENPSPADGTAS